MPDHESPSLDSVVADLTVAVGGLIRRLRAEVRASDLNLSEAGVIARLEREGPLTTAALARAEAMTPQSMGTLVLQLERRELVRREAHPTDGRQMLVALTPAGLAARHRQQAAKRAWLAAAMRRLEPAEIERLHHAIPLIRRLGED
ncbi:MarR family winged helix-turn-helix transcriptional regulator [Novosphingobium rosa]|uniref:MarR family winged helix-turn-helix transcriptional regulator n=1 Tax=Novosphingobium rosa TaxID=76978 RepID=UPI000833B3F6|nr:MarR family transcriptional regulator [Novosphingobium rosa]